MDIALVLVTYNRSDLLREILDSVLSLNTKPDVVHVIDNNSDDDTEEVTRKLAESSTGHLDIRYHNTGANLGGAGGFEFGSRLAYEAGHDWIWMADDDVVFAPDCLDELLKYRESAKIIHPLRVNKDGSCAELASVDYEINNIFRANPRSTTVQDVYHREWQTLAIKTIPFEGPIIHRSVFERIGFPNPKFFIFMDDLDFSLRAAKAGFEILCIRSARLTRQIPFSRNENLNSWKEYFMYRNFFKVQLSHATNTVGLFRVTGVYTATSLLHLAKGQFNSVTTIFYALMSSCKKDFPLNPRFLP